MNSNTYFVLNIPQELRSSLHSLTSHELLKPMQYNDIHITFLFCGELLNRIKQEQITTWTNGINEIMYCENKAVSVGDFALFPPEKHNLVVAKINVSNHIYELQQRIVNYTDSLGGIFKEIASLNRNWFPHCTLGKLVAKKSEVGVIGNEIIDKMTNIPDEFEVDGVSVVGMKSINLNLFY